MTYYARQSREYMPQSQFGPPPMARQQIGFPTHNSFPPLSHSRYPIYPQNPSSFGQRQQRFSPYQQRPIQRSNEMPNHLNTIMGHMGTITNGINMIRQIGSLMSLFRI